MSGRPRMNEITLGTRLQPANGRGDLTLTQQMPLLALVWRARHTPAPSPHHRRRTRGGCPDRGHKTRAQMRDGETEGHNETPIQSRPVHILERAARRAAGAGSRRHRTGGDPPGVGRHLRAGSRCHHQSSLPAGENPALALFGRELKARAFLSCGTSPHRPRCANLSPW